MLMHSLSLLDIQHGWMQAVREGMMRMDAVWTEHQTWVRVERSRLEEWNALRLDHVQLLSKCRVQTRRKREPRRKRMLERGDLPGGV